MKKADEWRRLLTVTPVILWLSWKDHSDEIPDTAPRVLPNEQIKPTHSRKRRSLYGAILYLCAGVRQLSTKTISMAQAAAGQTYLAMYCRQMLALNVVLTVNHHLAMHFASMIRLFGPIYAWWLFAFERFNGMLKKVNHNGHDGGQIEHTLLRNWVQGHLLFELLLHLPEDASEHEKELIHHIIDRESERGGMAVEIAAFRARVALDNISLPNQISTHAMDLHAYRFRTPNPDTPPIYELLLAHVRMVWPQHHFIRQFSSDDGIRFN